MRRTLECCCVFSGHSPSILPGKYSATRKTYCLASTSALRNVVSSDPRVFYPSQFYITCKKDEEENAKKAVLWKIKNIPLQGLECPHYENFEISNGDTFVNKNPSWK